MNVGVIKFKSLHRSMEWKSSDGGRFYSLGNRGSWTAEPLSLGVLLLSPNSDFPQSAEPSGRKTIQDFSFSDINVTAHIPKSNTTSFESSGQSELTVGYGLVKFNGLHKYIDY